MDWLFYWRMLVILQWMAILYVYSLDDTPFVTVPAVVGYPKRRPDYG